MGLRTRVRSSESRRRIQSVIRPYKREAEGNKDNEGSNRDAIHFRKFTSRDLRSIERPTQSLHSGLRPNMNEEVAEFENVLLSPDFYFSSNFGWNRRVQEIVFFVRSCDPVDLVPEQARQLLNALSRSGLPDDKKHELSEMARNVWEGWKVNLDDIEFVRKRSGDRKLIGKGGAAEVYLARMKMRDEKDYLEVTVKQLRVLRSKARGQFHQFMREVFLQKLAQHPCIVQTMGGYWPDPEEVDDEEEDEIEPFISPCIVMERLTHNLSQVQDKKLLESFDSKRRILGDVAAG